MYKQSGYLNKMIMRRVCHLSMNQSSHVHFIIAIKVFSFVSNQVLSWQVDSLNASIELEVYKKVIIIFVIVLFLLCSK